MVVAAFARFFGMTPLAVLGMGTVLWLELMERQKVLERGEAAKVLQLATAARWLRPAEDALEALLEDLRGDEGEVGEAQAARQAEVDEVLRKGGWR